ncbi:MAG: hypothetical protein JWR54_3769 [Mucilaginibacter sp.]|nr:hypothetical protein [Mucilaginibacter sp.]
MVTVFCQYYTKIKFLIISQSHTPKSVHLLQNLNT